MSILQTLLATTASSTPPPPPPPPSTGLYIWDGRNYTGGVFISSNSEQYPMTIAGGWMGPDLSVGNGSWGGTVNSYWMNFVSEGINYYYDYQTPNLDQRGNWKINHTGDASFLFQMWFYPTALNGVLVSIIDSGAGYQSDLIEINSSGYVSSHVWIGASTCPTVTSTTTVTLNDWNHVWVQFDASLQTLKVVLNNDTPATQTGVAGVFPLDIIFVLGKSKAQPITTDNYYNGRIAYVRVDNYANTYSSYIDQTPLFFNTYSSPLLGNSPLGGSLYFNGSSSCLQVPITSTGLRFAPGTSDFTIEWWQYYQSSGIDPYPYIFAIQNPSTSTVQQAVFIQSDTLYYCDIGFTNIGLGTLTSYQDQWSHIAIVRKNGYVTAYQNGFAINDTSQFNLDSNITNGGPSGFKFGIGAMLDASSTPTSSTRFKGYITNFNYINGAAKYIGNFVPSAIPFTVEAGVVTKMLLLASTQATMIYDTAASHNVLTNTNVTWSNYGPYTVPALWLDSGDSRSFTTGGTNYSFPTAISQNTSPYNWTNQMYGQDTILLFPASPPVTPQNGWTITDGTTTRTITNVNYQASGFGYVYIITFDSNADYSLPTSITINDPTLTWYDLGTSAHNATFPSGVTYSASNGGILHFASAYGQYATLSSPGAAPYFSVNVWGNLDNLPGGLAQFFTENFAGAINYNLGFEDNPAHINGGFYNGSWRTAGNFAPSTATWYNFTVTYDGSTVKFYVNGSVSQTSSYTGTAPSSNSGEAWVGRRWDGSEFIDAYIPVVQVYKYALTDAEVAALYSKFSSRY